eukprot:12908319-Alexandrium_andersonii.AAC.1
MPLAVRAACRCNAALALSAARSSAEVLQCIGARMRRAAIPTEVAQVQTPGRSRKRGIPIE